MCILKEKKIGLMDHIVEYQWNKRRALYFFENLLPMKEVMAPEALRCSHLRFIAKDFSSLA